MQTRHQVSGALRAALQALYPDIEPCYLDGSYVLVFSDWLPGTDAACLVHESLLGPPLLSFLTPAPALGAVPPGQTVVLRLASRPSHAEPRP